MSWERQPLDRSGRDARAPSGGLSKISPESTLGNIPAELVRLLSGEASCPVIRHCYSVTAKRITWTSYSFLLLRKNLHAGNLRTRFALGKESGIISWKL